MPIAPPNSPLLDLMYNNGPCIGRHRITRRHDGDPKRTRSTTSWDLLYPSNLLGTAHHAILSMGVESI